MHHLSQRRFNIRCKTASYQMQSCKMPEWRLSMLCLSWRLTQPGLIAAASAAWQRLHLKWNKVSCVSDSSLPCLPNCFLFFFIPCCLWKRCSQHMPKKNLITSRGALESVLFMMIYSSICPALAVPLTVQAGVHSSLSQHLHSSLTLTLPVFHAHKCFWNARLQCTSFMILFFHGMNGEAVTHCPLSYL